ncbi:hypothetical protein [Streptomyces sp. NPDC046859]|uniref:hypothetical protein n=1 Tax=Streptomyces sp. NPDC046859 TaxID=3155734 RepID=UPI0033F49132
MVTAVLADGDRYAGRTLRLTGPRLLAWREAVAAISAATGRPVVYTPVPTRAYGEALTGFGVPAEQAGLLVEVFETLLDGRNTQLTDDGRDVLGRAPRDFSTCVREATAAGAWTTGPPVA